MEDELVLVGDDSQIFDGDLSSEEFSGDGTKTIKALASLAANTETWQRMCKITARATTGSIFPDGMEVGDFFPALGSEVPAAGDKFKLLTLKQIADCSEWSMTLKDGTIDITRLNDGVKKARLGKKEFSGTLKSLFTQGVTDAEGGAVPRTMKFFKRATDGTVTYSIPENTPVYMLGLLRKTSSDAATEDFVFDQVYLHDLGLGGSAGSAQSTDRSMTLVGPDPVFYSLDKHVASV